MGFIGVQPATVPLTSSDITDGIISTAKIADDAVGNTKLDLSADYAFTGTVTGAGETSVAFKVRRRQNAGSQTQITGSDIFKTGQTNGQIITDYNLGSHFSNGRFTCPSDGLYQFTIIGLIGGSSGAVAGGSYTLIAYFTKNGETDSDSIDGVQMLSLIHI